MVKKSTSRSNSSPVESSVSSGVEQLLLSALERGGESLETGRYLITYREGMVDEGINSLKAQDFRLADARDFTDQAVSLEDTGDAEVLVFPEINVALVGGNALESHGISTFEDFLDESAIETIEPEYFVFAENNEYLRGFIAAANTIARDLGVDLDLEEGDENFETEVLGATWGLRACKVPPSSRSGTGIKVAILDTGMDLRHPEFSGRSFTTRSFVGQPVQDLNGHGTHCTGTACGPFAPPGNTPRYGIAFRSRIFIGKVLTNSGSGTTSSVLAGLNWAIANRCEIISMSLGSQSPVQAAYTAAGSAALARGCLVIAAAGNAASSTGAPANSPTIMSVASLDPNLKPSNFSNFGKINIAAPGRDVFSSYPLPVRHRILNGTSMAAPHVAGCAALWAQSNASLRGLALWSRLITSARKLPFPASRVGAGLVQAP